MITSTSLKHPTMIAKLRQAMRLAGMGKGELMNGHGNRTYITNRHGHNVVRCSYWPATNTFDFWIGGSGKSLDTDTIKSVLQSVQGVTMRKNPTQTECKQMWLDLMYGEEPVTRKAIDDIDALTPWSEVEPQWWLDMMHYRRTCEN